MKLTVEYLESLSACSQQVQVFRDTFPKGTTITQRSCKKAAAAGLSLCWLAAKLFDAPAYKQYDEASASARKQFNEAYVTADKQFKKTYTPARRPYNEDTDPAYKLYNKAYDTARKQYNEARAVIFYNAWKKDKK